MILYMSAGQVKKGWRPGSYDPPWSWEDEENEIGDDETMRKLYPEVVALGYISEPVLLGDDGRVWDGHHRIIIAARLGLHVPCDIAGRTE